MTEMEEGAAITSETPADVAADAPKFIQRVCCHCAVLLNVPEGEPIIVCGACKKTSRIAEMRPKRTYDGYLHTGCCCYKITSCFPKQSFFYLAILLTSFIIIGGFTVVAPEILPPFQTLKGCLLWSFSVFLSINVVCNFIFARTTDPGLPDEHPEASDGGSPLIALPPALSVAAQSLPGRNNMRFFLAFLLWVAVACAFVLYFCLALLAQRMRHASFIPGKEGTPGRPAGISFGMALAERLLPPRSAAEGGGRKVRMPGQALVGGIVHISWLFINVRADADAARLPPLPQLPRQDPDGVLLPHRPRRPHRQGVWMQRTAWWVGVLLPLPPSLTGPKGHAN